MIKIKLEKECYIGNAYYTKHLNEKLDEKYSLNFNCIISNSLNKKEKEIFDMLQGEQKVKLTLEVEKPILDDEETKYLSGVIRPFRNKIGYIMKVNTQCGEFIRILFKNNECIIFPYFKKGTMYKGMELNKEYSLEDLGL